LEIEVLTELKEKFFEEKRGLKFTKVMSWDLTEKQENDIKQRNETLDKKINFIDKLLNPNPIKEEIIKKYTLLLNEIK
jgi:hypothetical protein